MQSVVKGSAVVAGGAIDSGEVVSVLLQRVCSVLTQKIASDKADTGKLYRSGTWHARPATLTSRNAQHTRTPLHPAALASVPYGVVLVRVQAEAGFPKNVAN